jgi:drug/metabolite transporter (DMT)-like permease
MVNLFSVSLALIGSFITAIAALFLKKGMDKFSFSKIYKNDLLLGGIFLYVITIGIYVIALKGEELSILFPLGATTYIWSNIFSIKFLKEKMTFWKWISVFGIIIGVLFIGLGS